MVYYRHSKEEPKGEKKCINSLTSNQVLNGHSLLWKKQSNILKLSKDKKNSKLEDKPKGLFFLIVSRTYVYRARAAGNARARVWAKNFLINFKKVVDKVGQKC